MIETLLSYWFIVNTTKTCQKKTFTVSNYYKSLFDNFIGYFVTNHYQIRVLIIHFIHKVNDFDKNFQIEGYSMTFLSNYYKGLF